MAAGPIWLLVGLGALCLYLMGRWLWTPARWIMRLALNTAMGTGALLVWDHVSPSLHLAVGLNPYTAATVGLLGAPGFVLMLAIKFLLVRG